MRTLLVSALLITIGGCAGENSGVESEPTSPWFEAMQAIPRAEFTIGSDETFGSIDGFALIPPDRLVVADGLDGTLSLYDQGQLEDQVGGLGEGPEEFRSLGSVAVVSSDSLLVLDQSRFKLTLFRVHSHSLERIRTLELPVSVRGFCMLGRRLFVLGSHGGYLLHEVTFDGKLLASFGAVEGSTPLETALHSIGKVACSGEAAAIAFAKSTIGELRIFSSDGTPVMADSIPRFSRTEYDVGGGSVRPTLPEAGYVDVVEAIHWFGDELIVQLARGTESADMVPENRWWSTHSGWLEDPPPWPRVVAHTSDGLVYVVAEDPFPVIRGYSVR